MSVQNDDTLVTKGDLKTLYSDKIAPYLGGGISYYYTDRTGQELKTCYARIANKWNAVANTNVPFIIQSGNIIQPSSGLFTIPNGMRVELVFSSSAYPGGDTSYIYYNNTDSEELPLGNIDPFVTSSYINSTVLSGQWTNDTGHDVNISVRCNGTNGGTTLLTMASFTIKEIGRIVDPVKYVSNNSDLQETPVGNIISYMGNSVPKHYLACDGTTYSIGAYPELEAFIIDEFGSINYFGGNGSTTWAVPDLRGEFLRGSGTNGHTGQGNGDDVGVHQDATEHNFNRNSLATQYAYYNTAGGPTTAYMDPRNRDMDIASAGRAQVAGSGQSYTDAPARYTSRPTNTSVKYCIKYESTYHAFFGNAAYKVSVAASVNDTNGAQIAFDPSDIIGDSSLVVGNTLVAPIQGWYAIGMSWSQAGSGDVGYYLRINDVNAGYNRGISVDKILYLEKGDVVTIYKESGTANSGRVNFCLLTSNYNPTIVSADSVYSEHEQMIGYWKDGKPLYQKTYFATTPSSTITGVNFITDSNLVNCDYITISSAVLKRSDGSECQTLPFHQDSNWANVFTRKASGYLTYAANFRGFDNVPIFVTIQYTKTTDTASTLQVENSLLLNRPDLWEVGREYNFGGGLYGIRKTGTITAAIDERVWTAIVTTSSGNLPSIVDSGGWIKWGDEGTHDYKYSINSTLTGLTGWGNTLGAWSVMRTGDTQIALWNTSGLARTNAPYDVWVTYRK